MAAARPDIDEKTSQLVSKGRWSVPGYKVCFAGGVARLRTIAKDFTGEFWRPFVAVDKIMHPYLCCLY